MMQLQIYGFRTSSFTCATRHCFTSNVMLLGRRKGFDSLVSVKIFGKNEAQRPSIRRTTKYWEYFVGHLFRFCYGVRYPKKNQEFQRDYHIKIKSRFELK